MPTSGGIQWGHARQCPTQGLAWEVFVKINIQVWVENYLSKKEKIDFVNMAVFLKLEVLQVSDHSKKQETSVEMRILCKSESF